MKNIIVEEGVIINVQADILKKLMMNVIITTTKLNYLK